jgi:dihydroxy-acid dehydratase
VADNLKDLKKRSDGIFETIKQTPFMFVTLGVMRGLGIDEKEILNKPLIGIANSWNEINPGHAHLRELGEFVKRGVIEAGGLPMMFNTIAPCDGFANGHEGMRFILPQRDIIADSVEAMVEAHRLDALVTLSSCDKINPGMLMAAVRLDIPTICVPGGPNIFEIEFMPGYKGVENMEYDDIFHKIKCISCATPGSCSLMGTANTTQCLMEALGMTLPNAATAPAVTTMKQIFAKESGKRIVQMLREDLRPSKIMTREAMLNAVMVDLAIGGSTNSTLHLPAIAAEMGIELDLEVFNEYAKKIPTIANISPSGKYSISDLYRAGGIPAILNRLKDFLYGDCMTVSGKTIGSIAKAAKVGDSEVIRTFDNPVYPEGGTVVLKGNLAPEGAVVKQSAVAKSMQVFEGTAQVFESESDAIKAVADNKVTNGSVIVIRNEGPKGGPGMPELLALTSTLMLAKHLDRVALITDGRFSGATQGPCIGHLCPEAYVGGPIAALRNGDIIKIDIPNRSLNAVLTDAEIAERLKGHKPYEKNIKSKVLLKYRTLVTSAAKGAVLAY